MWNRVGGGVQVKLDDVVAGNGIGEFFKGWGNGRMEEDVCRCYCMQEEKLGNLEKIMK